MDWSTFSLGNAAGFIKTDGLLLDNILRSPATDVTLGSYTLDARAGNPEPNYWDAEDGTSINALGLPNIGMRDGSLAIAELVSKIKSAGKRARVSIAGFSPEEYYLLAHYALKALHVDEIEVNLGCPNVREGEKYHPILSYSTELVTAILSSVHRACAESGGPRFAVKVSPYEPGFLRTIAGIVAERNNWISSVVTTNTFPNGLFFEDGRRVLSVPQGGIAGTALRGIALGQVDQFTQALKGTGVNVIGVGGISRGQDVVNMREAGASGIQIGTAFGKEKAKIFADILVEAGELVG
jgi:dihydroorotate dehydrogenase (fumarate)